MLLSSWRRRYTYLPQRRPRSGLGVKILMRLAAKFILRTWALVFFDPSTFYLLDFRTSGVYAVSLLDRAEIVTQGNFNYTYKPADRFTVHRVFQLMTWMRENALAPRNPSYPVSRKRSFASDFIYNLCERCTPQFYLMGQPIVSSEQLLLLIY